MNCTPTGNITTSSNMKPQDEKVVNIYLIGMFMLFCGSMSYPENRWVTYPAMAGLWILILTLVVVLSSALTTHSKMSVPKESYEKVHGNAEKSLKGLRQFKSNFRFAFFTTTIFIGALLSGFTLSAFFYFILACAVRLMLVFNLKKMLAITSKS